MMFSISIVCHGSGPMVQLLLNDLRHHLPDNSEILITLNKPEDETFLDEYADLPIRVLRNVRDLGFGANHNQAYAASTGQYFVIANPDIRLTNSPFERLRQALQAPGVGAAAPAVLSAGGQVEDSVRRFPTVARLAERVIGGRRTADYDVSSALVAVPVDWAAGMFIAFARTAFAAVGGFDTRYFMYMEDADICRRLGAAQWRVVLAPGAQVIHNAQRASRRDARHLRWHLRSALRFLFHI